MLVKCYPDNPLCRITASEGLFNGVASGEIIVHFRFFLNRKMRGGEGKGVSVTDGMAEGETDKTGKGLLYEQQCEGGKT